MYFPQLHTKKLNNVTRGSIFQPFFEIHIQFRASKSDGPCIYIYIYIYDMILYDTIRYDTIYDMIYVIWYTAYYI